CGADCISQCPGLSMPNPTAPVTPQPTKSPNPPSPTRSPVNVATDNSRVIAYLGNWEFCPSEQQLASYTHIIIAFAVTYQWTVNGNIYDTSCTDEQLPAVPTCGNTYRQDLIDSWRAQGKKVILGFGGAGMGGSWNAPGSGCWEHCFDKGPYLSDQIVSIVSAQNLDGVDLDYEYFYNTQEQQKFLKDMTSSLRTKLDALGAGYELTHAPMDSDVVPGTAYYNILQEHTDQLNFLMPQFYNGITRADVDNFDGVGVKPILAQSVYKDISVGIFGGQQDKVVYGFCLKNLDGTNACEGSVDDTTAVSIVQSMNSYYRCNGGIFFWGADGLRGSVRDLKGGPPAKTAQPTATATPNPTLPPVAATPDPTGSPTVPPTPQPTPDPMVFACKCVFPTPATPEPTKAPTQPPTEDVGNCVCDPEVCTTKYECEGACGGNKCEYPGGTKTCQAI
ncbi:hypothetical protein ACHAWF_004416, partial [Thalassiosira exigua]